VALTKLTPTRHLAWQVVGECAILLDLVTDATIGLNLTGTLVFQRLLAGEHVETLAASLVDEFDVTLDQALVDVRELVASLLARGLVEVHVE